MIQLLNIFMEMNNALHLTRFLIICQCIHRFHLNGYVPVLNTTAVVALIFLVFFRVISNHDFPVILHILIGFLTRLARILVILIIVCNVLITCRNPVTFVYLHLHDFEFILFGTLTVTDLLTGFGTLIVSGHKIRIFANHLRIVTDSTTIITRLCTQQATVESCHHIIRFHLQDKIKVFKCPVIVTYLCTKQTTVIMPQEVIGIDVQCQVIITHGTSQIILMETRQCTIDIITGILRTQMNGLIQVTFGICILALLQTNNSTCAPSIGIITVHIDCRFKVIQSLYCILLLQRHFATHQISTRVPGSYLQ